MTPGRLLADVGQERTGRAVELNGGGRIVKQIEALHGGQYDHYQPANHLMRSPGNLLDQLDEATCAHFHDLFHRLNQLLCRCEVSGPH